MTLLSFELNMLLKWWDWHDSETGKLSSTYSKMLRQCLDSRWLLENEECNSAKVRPRHNLYMYSFLHAAPMYVACTSLCSNCRHMSILLTSIEPWNAVMLPFNIYCIVHTNIASNIALVKHINTCFNESMIISYHFQDHDTKFVKAAVLCRKHNREPLEKITQFKQTFVRTWYKQQKREIYLCTMYFHNGVETIA